MTTSHLRFSDRPIRSSYLIQKADFVAVHQAVFLEKLDLLDIAKPGAVVLLNTPYLKEEVWPRLPALTQERIIARKLRLYAIDAYRVAHDAGMGRKVNTIMQTCFFAISGILHRDEAIKEIKKSIRKTYGLKGEALVEMNYAAVDRTLERLHAIDVPNEVSSTKRLQPVLKGTMEPFVSEVIGMITGYKGDLVKVSQMPADGTWPTGTTRYEKRNIAQEVPVWDPDTCIQCNKCVSACPHSVIRSNVFDQSFLSDAPDGFLTTAAKGKKFGDEHRFNILVAVEDCTGCALCVEVCPAKNKSQTNRKAINMAPQLPLRDRGIALWDFFLSLLKIDRALLEHDNLKESQFLEPLFEFSGACLGCGETPYIKLASQLFGDRMVIANATGCSSIYGGNLPTTPWRKNDAGRGPAWSNSLFEDNAEFGLGFRLAIDNHTSRARELLAGFKETIDSSLIDEMLNAPQRDESDIVAQRKRVEALNTLLEPMQTPEAKALYEMSEYLVKKSVWIIGGDGWAYDIGYVARVALGANDQATVKAFIEAERYEGVSIIIAYAHCIAHGYDLRYGFDQQKRAVDSGLWPIFRFNPEKLGTEENPMSLDYKGPKIDVKDFMYRETRFTIAEKTNHTSAGDFLETAAQNAREMFGRYSDLHAYYEPQNREAIKSLDAMLKV